MNETVNKKTLSGPALTMINKFLHLPIPGHDINAPYFNNQRVGVRGGLRVLIGKGNPADIAEEALIMSLKDKIDLSSFSDEQLKAWLVQNYIGIDCSGFLFYVLDAETHSRHLGRLAKHITFRPTWDPLRKLIYKLRPVENAGVSTFAHANNSKVVALNEILPGDFIVYWRAGTGKHINHVLLAHEIEYLGNVPHIIHYSQSFAWSTDGRFNHGVRQGIITVVDPSKTLLAQKWEERGKTGNENETYSHATTAQRVELRRLHAFYKN